MTFGRRRGVILPLAIGLAGGGLTLGYALYDARRALVAWIAAFGLGIATALGAMVLGMILEVTGARWWLPFRRVFVAVAGTMPLYVLLFVPIGASFMAVYPWASPPAGVADHVAEALEHQRAWNNPTAFLARSAAYLGTWTVLALLIRRGYAVDSRGPSADGARRARAWSAVALPIVAFTLTFAAFDWLMALEPGWTSNVFGLYVFTSGLVTAIAALAIGSWLAARGGLLPEGVARDHWSALARLMLMSVILWTYIAFFQLLLVWIANLPHEVSFYDARSRGSWATVDVLLFAGRFLLPFFALLPRAWKRTPGFVAGAGVWLVLTSVIDFAWLVIPASGARLSWADVLPFVCVIGLTSAYAVHLAGERGAPEAPADPALEEALRYRSP